MATLMACQVGRLLVAACIVCACALCGHAHSISWCKPASVYARLLPSMLVLIMISGSCGALVQQGLSICCMWPLSPLLNGLLLV